MSVNRERPDKRSSSAAKGELDLKNFVSDSFHAAGPGSLVAPGSDWKLDHPSPIIAAGGVPDESALPTKDFLEAARKVLTNNPAEALRYGGVLGFEGLRATVALRQSKLDGVAVSPENIIIHNGGSGCLDNICQAFVNPGDVAIVEDPNFFGTTRTIKGHGAEVVGAKVDDEGVIPDAVEAAIRRAEGQGKRVKLILVTPDYQNPTAAVLSIDRREALIKLCADHQVLIIEDATYSELYFEEPVPPSIYSLSDGQGVMKFGTFSKVIATGLRVGWVQAPKEYIDAMGRVRFDMGTSPLLNHILNDYLRTGKLDSHLQKMRRSYSEKAEVLATSLLENCGPHVKFNRPNGGFFFWVETPEIATDDLLKEAAKEGLFYSPGKAFFLDKTHGRNLGRMAFSSASPDELEQVGPRLALALHHAGI